MSDKELIDSNNFEALAYGVFTNAVDTDSGRAALLDAYNQYDWADKEKALATLEYYGEALKYKNKDQTEFSDVEKVAPVRLEDIPLTRQEDGSIKENDQDLYDKWEKANEDYLSTTTQPEYVVARKQLQEDIKAHASRKRREANQTNIRGNIGETLASVTDLGVRFLQQEVSGIEPYINSAVNIFTDGYDLNDHLTELTNPETDGTFIADAAGAAGSVTGVLAAGMTAGPAGVAAYTGTQSLDAIGTRYQETKRKTGDTSAAIKAAAIETGSQALQLGGENLVFGKLAKRLVGKLPGVAEFGKELVEGVVVEGASEGAGQVISNAAENVELGRPTEEDLSRGVVRATILGAAGAGLATTGAHVFPSKANSKLRAAEIEQDGFPSTPVTTQVIGDIEPGDLDTIPGEEDVVRSYDPLDDPDLVEIGKTTSVVDGKESSEYTYMRVDNTPSALNEIQDNVVPAFSTEDGTYVQHENGAYSKEGALPFDRSVFINESILPEVAQAIVSGEHVILDDNNNPVIEKVDDQGNKSHVPIDYTNDPSIGAYPLSVSREKGPSASLKVRPLAIGKKIQQVNVDRSIGAAGSSPIETRESTYGRKLRESTTLPPEMRKVGEEGINYEYLPDSEVSHEINSFVRSAGIDKSIQALKDPNLDQRLRNGLNTYLHNYFVKQIRNATANGDFNKLSQVTADYENAAPILGTKRSEAGQAFRLLQGAEHEAGTAISKVFKSTFAHELEAQAKEEGVSPIEVGESAKILENTTKQIESLSAQIEKQEQIEAGAVIPEVAALNEVINDIELKAEEKLNTDLSNIDKETADIESAVAATEKKAQRTKRKDVQALEAAVAKDSEQLVSALNDAKDLKNITAEESAKLEDDINKSLVAAEKKANAEITKALKEERAAKETEHKTRMERADERVSKAEEALANKKKAAQEQLKKTKLKERDLLSKGEDTTAVQERIRKIEEGITNAAQRVIDAKEARKQLVEELNAKDEATQAAEELYKELESGVEIKVVPTGRKRAISVRTKRSGLNVTKLFNTKSEAYGPLSALSRNVNELAGTLRQSMGARAGNNERISALQARINENKVALEKARQRDALSDSEKAKIAAAKKRLAELDKAKKEATLESRIPVRDKEKYTKYKERRDQAAKAPKTESAALKQAKEDLKRLNAERAKAERLIKRREAAARKAVQAAKNEAANQDKISELEQLKKTQNLSHAAKQKIDGEIAARKAANEMSPLRRNRFYKLWVASQIGSVLGITVGTGISGLVSPVAKGFGLIGPTLHALGKNIANGSLTKYKYPLLSYMAGLTNPDAFVRGLNLAHGALFYGERLENIIDRTELVAENVARYKPLQYQETIRDYVKFTKALEFHPAKDVFKNIGVLAEKIAGISSGSLLRVLSAVEAITYSVHDSGFDRAAAAYYYNKAQGENVSPEELAVYKYSPKENWESAQQEAKFEAAQLRSNGIEFTPQQEYIAAVEKYQSKRPREIQVSAYKEAAQIVLNSPAPGYIGLINDHLGMLIENMEGTPLSGFKYLTPFANSIANQMSMAAELTPLGLIDLYGKNPITGEHKSNRTSFERSMILSSSITGTATAMAIALAAIKNLELPEDERWFDLIGNYSSSKNKRDAFVQNGGILYSIKIGNLYVPYNETPFVALLGGVASTVDRVRDGKEPVPENGAMLAQAAFSQAVDTLHAVGSISMLRGITDVIDTLSSLKKDGDNEVAQIKLARIFMNTMKGFIPGASILRNISRYSENPVDAKRDFTSAMVEGIPVLQGMFGKPALNIFGEEMQSDANLPYLKIHRIFSTQGSDIDMRWLAENGYSVPNITNMRFSKNLQEYVEGNGDDSIELDYNLKYQAYKAASADLRNLVGQYRARFSTSAPNEKVQKALNKDFSRILAKYSAMIVSRK